MGVPHPPGFVTSRLSEMLREATYIANDVDVSLAVLSPGPSVRKGATTDLYITQLAVPHNLKCTSFRIHSTNFAL